MKHHRTKLALAAAVALATLSTLPAPSARANLTGTFDIALAGFPDRGDAGLDIVGPLKVTANTTRVFAGAALDGSDVTVSSRVTPLGNNQFRATFRMESEERHEFLPAGTRFNGDPITDAFIDLGGFFYNTSDPVNFTNPVSTTGYSDFFVIEVNDAPRPNQLNFTAEFLANRTALEGYGNINAGGGDVAGRGFDGVEVTLNYTMVPEPGAATLALVGLGGLIARRPRRRR